MNGDQGSERVQADPPVKFSGDDPSAGQGQPHGRTPRPGDDAERENATDDATASDGVAFFEGGDGREEAQGDIERNG